MNGKASHILPPSTQFKAKPSKSFSIHPHSDLIAFAERCVEVLKEWSNGSLVHGLTRVDIMQTADGNFSLNEFESFEANYFGKSLNEDIRVKNLLNQFWAVEIEKALVHG